MQAIGGPALVWDNFEKDEKPLEISVTLYNVGGFKNSIFIQYGDKQLQGLPTDGLYSHSSIINLDQGPFRKLYKRDEKIFHKVVRYIKSIEQSNLL